MGIQRLRKDGWNSRRATGVHRKETNRDAHHLLGQRDRSPCTLRASRRPRFRANTSSARRSIANRGWIDGRGHSSARLAFASTSAADRSSAAGENRAASGKSASSGNTAVDRRTASGKGLAASTNRIPRKTRTPEGCAPRSVEPSAPASSPTDLVPPREDSSWSATPARPTVRMIVEAALAELPPLEEEPIQAPAQPVRPGQIGARTRDEALLPIPDQPRFAIQDRPDDAPIAARPAPAHIERSREQASRKRLQRLNRAGYGHPGRYRRHRRDRRSENLRENVIEAEFSESNRSRAAGMTEPNR